MIPFHVVIPARLASTRLPGKPLLLIGGKPMVVRVAEQAAKSGAQQIWIATDHPSILAAAQEHDYQACLTNTGHVSGTDRIAEVASQQQWTDDTIVVNVQGDEPLIPPQLIHGVAQHLHNHPQCAIATACHPVHDEQTLRNPNVVKVVLDSQGNALYFSRAPIPYPRDASKSSDPSLLPEPPRFTLPEGQTSRPLGENQTLSALRHIGIYAYRASFLRDFGRLKPPAIEQTEALEQLRALYHGYKIGVMISDHAPPGGVDTEQDLQVVRKIFDAGV